MTINDIKQFASEHECGELTPVCISYVGEDYWVGAKALRTSQDNNGVAQEHLLFIASRNNHFHNLNSLSDFRESANSEIIVSIESAVLKPTSIARGATPDGGAKAIILQI